MDEIKTLCLEDKIALCSGADCWHTKAMPEAGIPILRMSDGPHGLRREMDGPAPLFGKDSHPATCFPTAALSACCFDEALFEELGRALGEEAAAQGVGLLLGPGANIKRNPLCGRNFEYFSEDPLLAGKLAAAFIRGVESTGVGACLKHFACNSQETMRMNSDSVLDERTLREIYLRAFEIAVKEGRPSAVMAAYNKLNGEHCTDSKKLLTDILREEWGFDGLVVTDWSALYDRVRAFEAGCDLNMPGGSAYQEREAAAAVREGRLDEHFVDRSAARVAKLAQRAQAVQKARPGFDAAAHHALAKRIAAESAVLLKNDKKLLPLDEKLDILFLGPMAAELRFQGGGSSHVHPIELHQITELRPDIPWLPGCAPDGGADKKLQKEATAAAKKAGVPVIFAGLPDARESEGFDRDDMTLPEGVNALIEAVAAVNPHTVVVLFAGSPVETPWADKVKSILWMGLPGEAGAEAALDLLFGKSCPCGRLAESWPVRYADCVSAGYYAGEHRDAHYREGIYVGYRYYRKAGVACRFPFGHGLSYTEFRYSDLTVGADAVSCRVKNVGKCDGAEAVQLWISPPEGAAYRAPLELRGFRKVFLKRGETKTVTFPLEERSFAVWQDGWLVPAGDYGVHLGGSPDKLALHGAIRREGAAWAPEVPAWYLQPQGAPGHTDFERLLGRPAPERRAHRGSFTMDSCLGEMQEDSAAARLIVKLLEQKISKEHGGDRESPGYRAALTGVMEAPLRAIKIMLAKDTQLPDALLALCNGRLPDALRLLLGKR